MTRTPRLLFLCQTLPYPPNGGVWIRSYNVLRLLARDFQITALCFDRPPGTTHERDGGLTALRQFGRVESFPIPQNESRARYVWDHLRSLLTGRVYTVFRHQSRDYRRRLSDLLRQEPFDLVHMDSLDLSRYLPRLSGMTVVCVHHNVESVLLGRRSAAESTRLRRWYVAHQARLQHEEERRWCGRVDLNVVVSEQDGRLLRRIVPDARIAVVPNGVNTDEFRPAEVENREGLVFVGGSYWFPNRDGMIWFCNEVLPRLRRALGSSEPRITWVGEVSAEDRSLFSREFGIRLTGYVQDIRPWVQSAACYVVPLRVGGGTRLKVLDAWAMGKAVVSTTVGCEGLQAVDGENILIRDDPGSFAEAVLAVLRRPLLQQSLGARARATVEAEYSWERLGERMSKLYLGLVGERNGSTVAGSTEHAALLAGVQNTSPRAR